jgi:hypothetical protein
MGGQYERNFAQGSLNGCIRHHSQDLQTRTLGNAYDFRTNLEEQATVFQLSADNYLYG